MFWSFKVYFGVQYPMPEPEPFLVLETGLYFDVPYPSLSTEPIQSWIHDLQRVLHTDPSTSPKVARPCLSDDGSRNSHAAAGTGGEVIIERWKGNLQEPPILGLKIVPSGYVKIAIENDHLWWIFPLKMVISNSYVKLPEGKSQCFVLGKNM